MSLLCAGQLHVRAPGPEQASQGPEAAVTVKVRPKTGRARRPKKKGWSLPSISISDAIRYGAAILGLAFGYGKLVSDVAAVKQEQDRQGRTLEKIFDHVSFTSSGQVGPAPPLPQK